jgi:hypothetical protein
MIIRAIKSSAHTELSSLEKKGRWGRKDTKINCLALNILILGAQWINSCLYIVNFYSFKTQLLRY